MSMRAGPQAVSPVLYVEYVANPTGFGIGDDGQNKRSHSRKARADA
jgi:hypothetical protein